MRGAPGQFRPGYENKPLKNQGKAAAGASTTRYYLSLVRRKTGDSKLLGSRVVSSLGAGASSQATRVAVVVPTSTAPGTYYLLPCADDLARVTETDEWNNCAVATSQVAVGRPDLVVTAVGNPPSTATKGSSFAVTDTVANHGVLAAEASTTRYYSP